MLVWGEESRELLGTGMLVSVHPLQLMAGLELALGVRGRRDLILAVRTAVATLAQLLEIYCWLMSRRRTVVDEDWYQQSLESYLRAWLCRVIDSKCRRFEVVSEALVWQPHLLFSSFPL